MVCDATEELHVIFFSKVPFIATSQLGSDYFSTICFAFPSLFLSSSTTYKIKFKRVKEDILW